MAASRALTAVLLLVSSLGLSGCGEATVPSFDGAAALAFVEGLALRDDGTPRFRMPGSPGQAEGAQYLAEASKLPGWTATWSNFTGAEYLQLERSIVAAYESSTYCSSEDRAARSAWPFHNLVVTKPGPPASPVVMLGAHWDSQMDSNYDPDPAKRGDPDPGANDGASGVGVLLQMMRHLDEGPKLPFTVQMFFIDGEDGFYNCYALAGSLHYAQRSASLPDLFLLLDMVGDPDARFIRESSSVGVARGVVDLIWSKAHALGGNEHFTDTQTSIQDDHLPFIRKGVPSVDIIDAGRSGSSVFPPQWDTTHDTVDKLDPDMLALVGDVLLQTLHSDELEAMLEGRTAMA